VSGPWSGGAAWQVRAWTGRRRYGYTSPANRISLTDRPGCLRYALAPMTHESGLFTGYQPYVTHSSTYDPGLELHRPLAGDQWQLEARADYVLPFANGRGFFVHVVFGGGPGRAAPAASRLYHLQVMRMRAVNFNRLLVFWSTGLAPDPSLASHHHLAELTAVEYGVDDPPESSVWISVRRAGGRLTASWSADGTAWHTAFEQETGTLLAGLDQRVILAGESWFVPADSYADFRYVRVTGPDGALLVPPADWPSRDSTV
jgi:hypothetical protein